MLTLFTLQVDGYRIGLAPLRQQHFCHPEESLVIGEVVGAVVRRQVLLVFGEDESSSQAVVEVVSSQKIASPASPPLWQQGIDFNIVAERCGQRWFKRSSRVRLWLQPGEPVVRGERLMLVLAWQPLGPARHPLGPSVGQKWRQLGVDGTAQVRSIHLHVPSPPLWGQILDHLRRALSTRLEQQMAAPVQGLLKALLLADRSDLDPDMAHQWARLGLVHLLSISGLHVASFIWLARGTLILLLRGLAPRLVHSPWPDGWALAWGLLYCAMAGAHPPVVRATLMVVLWWLHHNLLDWTTPQQDLASACWMLLLCMPQWLFSLSFQLSFLAMLVMLFWLPQCPCWRPSRGPMWLRSWVVFLQQSLWMTLGTTWWSYPWVVDWTGMLPLLAPLANVIAVPWCSGVMLPASLLLAWLWLLLPLPHGVIVYWQQAWLLVIQAMEKLAHWPLVPWAEIYTMPNSAYPLWLLMGTWPYWRTWPKCGTWRAWALVMMLGGAWPFGQWIWACQGFTLFRGTALQANRLQVMMLDVGQAQALLLHGSYPSQPTCSSPGQPSRFPWTGCQRQVAILIDGGGRTARWSGGRSIVLPMLRAQGIQALDVLVVTHSHLDHLGGLFAVVGHLPIGQIWGPKTLLQSPLGRALYEQAQQHHIPWWHVDSSSRPFQVGPLRMEVLGPPPNFATFPHSHALAKGASPNETGLILQVTQGCFRALLLADSTVASEQLLVEQGLAPITLLQVAHHGSKGGTSAALLQHIRPQMAWMSLQQGNRFGFPHPEVLRRLVDVPTVWRTDLQGMLWLETDGQSLYAHGQLAEHWQQSLAPCAAFSNGSILPSP